MKSSLADLQHFNAEFYIVWTSIYCFEIISKSFRVTHILTFCLQIVLDWANTQRCQENLEKYFA